MSRYINPFTDFGFKRLFGQEVTKDLLIDFLNDLLAGEHQITDITFRDKEQIPLNKEDRVAIYDVFCTTNTGEMIIVEMQNKHQANFKDRALFYSSCAIAGQAPKGDWDYKIKAVYGVFFMNFTIGNDDKFRTDVIMADRETGKPFSDKFRQIFLCLPKFDIENAADCKTDFERWIYLLKKLPMLDRIPFDSKNEIFVRLGEMAEIGAFTKEELEMYETSLAVHRDNIAVLAQEREEGKAEGWAEAEAKHKQERVANVKALLAIGNDLNTLITIMNLTPEEIEQVKS